MRRPSFDKEPPVSGSTFRVGMTVRAALAVTVIALAVGAAGVRAASVGWQGESIISPQATGDGWEPAIAADPSAPYVYAAWMQYSGPSITISMRTSTDGGSTWGAVKPLCASCGKGQYDITLATSSTGVVYATFMQGNHISFTRSTDHAATWSTPIKISAGTWADKPWMTTSANGQDIYVMWSSHGNIDATSSHDAGLTFSTPVQITNESNIYYYPNGGTVLPNGTAVMVASEYPEKGNNTKITGPINIVAFRSTNGGGSWQRTVVDTLNTGATFATSSVTTVASDASGTLVLLYSGSTSVGANGHVYVRRSTDAGVTWTADAKVSDATSGASYKTAAGFGTPYGDYDTVAINSAGKAVAVMGEGDTGQVHGDIWANRQN